MILGTYGAGYFGYHYGAWAGVARRDRDGHARRPAARHRHGHLRRRPHHLRCRDQHHRARRGAVPRLADLRRAARRRPDPVAEDPRRAGRSPSTPLERRAARRSRRRTSSSSPSSRRVRARAGAPTCRRSSIISLLLLVVTWYVLWRTSFGLRLRSCGESPSAAESLGVHVLRYKFVAVLISGGLAGLARRLPGDGRVQQLPRRPDRRPRLHRPRGDDLRQLAPGRAARRGPACSATPRRSACARAATRCTRCCSRSRCSRSRPRCCRSAGASGSAAAVMRRRAASLLGVALLLHRRGARATSPG